jgi:hypothetical protein
MVGVMMKFPRKPDGTLDFKAFSNLPLELQKEAFTDLKTNGTAEERQSFQAHRAQIQRERQELEMAKARLVEMEKEMERLRLKELELTASLKSEVTSVVGQAFIASVTSSSTPSSSPASKTPSTVIRPFKQ